MKIKYALMFLLLISFVLPIKLFAQRSNDIQIITQNFDNDPQWENVNNRVNCSDCPQRTQDFGWAPTNHNGSGPGEIGGTIWKSTTPAYYAMPIGKSLTFKDAFSASGKISVIAPNDEGFGMYLGFFGHERQGWRVWSSCGARIGQFYYDVDGYPEGIAKWHLDYKTGEAGGAILNQDQAIPGDGSVHTWELKYEPNVTVADMEWLDPRMPKYFQNQIHSLHTDTLLAAFQKDDPTMTKNRILEILLDARDKGLVDDWYRKGLYHLWNLEIEPENIKGRITFTFDGDPVSYFLLPGDQDEYMNIDRFGFWNMQMYTGSIQFYVSDLVINGKEIDFSQDPHWEGLNNRITFTETDFHSRHNYGYSQTNYTGEDIGEIGGRFWGTEVKDPLHGYYAVDIGELTLDDPITFYGKVNFVEGAVDGRMLIGYFNKEEKMAPIKGEYKGNPPNQYLGLEVMDQTRVGYNFTAVCSPKQTIASEVRGPIFIPDRIQREFVFKYDPDEGEAGRITVTLGDDVFSVNLTPEQRKVGATFNRFGLLNPRKGGKYVDVYYDDLSYSSRKSDSERERHQQEIIEVPYPKWGRKYK